MHNCFKLIFSLIIIFLFGCYPNDNETENWKIIEEKGKGETVNFLMNGNDPFVSNYMYEYVIPKVYELYGITLKIISDENKPQVEFINQSKKEIDMVWTYGINSDDLRKNNMLYGPFINKLPNSNNIDLNDPFIKYDFQIANNGYKCPWGQFKQVLIYNSDSITVPPKNFSELSSFIVNNPGKFTIPLDFNGSTFLNSLLISEFGGPSAIYGPFNLEEYEIYSSLLFKKINKLMPHFWNGGETLPNSVIELHKLFNEGKVWITMSNNTNDVVNKKLNGLFPNNAKPFLLREGYISETHYLAILEKSSNKNAAMIVINFLISTEAQFEKNNPEVWADLSILDYSRLSKEDQNKYDSINETYLYINSLLERYPKLINPNIEYSRRLAKDFKKL